MSRRSFSRAFRAETQKGWAEWVGAARLSQAATLILGGARVTDAALAVGYATPSAFSVAFRRMAGVSPIALHPSRGPGSGCGVVGADLWA
jgi:AraC-like DNA-binding protein